MIDPLPQTVENQHKFDRVVNYTKSLSIPKLKNATLFIGYFNFVSTGGQKGLAESVDRLY